MNDMQEPSMADLHAYIDGHLDDTDRARIESWLARHPERAAEVRGWQRDAQQLRAAFGGLPAATAQAALDPTAIRARRRHRQRTRLALAAALVLTLGVGGLGGWQARGLVAPVAAAPMADAVQAYRMFAMDHHAPLDVTQRHPGDLQAWLDQHFQHAARLPDLDAAGFHPIGGRLLATDGGPAAMVLYADGNGGAISFYIRPPSSHAGPLARGERREGQLATAYWSGNGYNYALVSRVDSTDLRVIRDASLRSAG
jgi:anti-sigma factor RsiW